MKPLPSVVVANIHRRFTGVSATVARLVPQQQKQIDIAVIDTGKLKLAGKICLLSLILGGFTKPPIGKRRIFHARRDIEMILGLLLKYVFRQQWCLLFTAASRKPPGRVLGWLIRQMDAVIATSERSKHFLGLPCTIIPHGVDTDKFIPGLRDRKSNIHDFGSSYLIGSFGRVRYSKGTDLFVDALLAVLPNHPSFAAYWAGLVKPKDKPFLANLKHQIKARGLDDRMTFLGHVEPDKVANLYQRSHLVIAPSRTEGFGLTPLEAMACGVGVITSDEGIWPQLIQPGKQGHIFSNGNLTQLITYLDSLLGDVTKLEAVGVQGRQTILHNYTLIRESECICNLYRTLIHTD